MLKPAPASSASSPMTVKRMASLEQSQRTSSRTTCALVLLGTLLIASGIALAQTSWMSKAGSQGHVAGAAETRALENQIADLSHTVVELKTWLDKRQRREQRRAKAHKWHKNPAPIDDDDAVAAAAVYPYASDETVSTAASAESLAYEELVKLETTLGSSLRGGRRLPLVARLAKRRKALLAASNAYSRAMARAAMADVEGEEAMAVESAQRSLANEVIADVEGEEAEAARSAARSLAIESAEEQERDEAEAARTASRMVAAETLQKLNASGVVRLAAMKRA